MNMILLKCILLMFVDEKVEVDENMSSQSKDPLQSDSLVQPLVEELAITRSPSSSEGEIEQVMLKHFLIFIHV